MATHRDRTGVEGKPGLYVRHQGSRRLYQQCMREFKKSAVR